MRKFFTLLTLLVFCAAGFAQTYEISGPSNGNVGKGGALSYKGTTQGSMTVTALYEGSRCKDLGDGSFSDGTSLTYFCASSTNLRLSKAPTSSNISGEMYTSEKDSDKGKTWTAFQLETNLGDNQIISEIKFYLHAASGKVFYLYDVNNDEVITLDAKEGNTAIGSDVDYIATATGLQNGSYILYCTGHTAGFCGIKYTVEKADDFVSRADGSKVWDFSKVKAVSGTSYATTSSGYYYSTFKSSNRLMYNDAEFDGSTIKFYAWGSVGNHYLIKENRYAENGTLEISPSVPGAVRVTFECPDDENVKSSYVSIGYSTSDGGAVIWPTGSDVNTDMIKAGETLVTDWIQVEAKTVWIHFNGNGKAGARVSKVEYVTADGDVAGSFSTQKISNGGKTSTWAYDKKYQNNINGLVGGVLDNDIWYYSYDDENGGNTNSNIRFVGGSSYYLRSQGGSSIYIPVPAGSSGTITLGSNGTKGRYFYLYDKDDDVPFVAEYTSEYDGKETTSVTTNKDYENKGKGTAGKRLFASASKNEVFVTGENQYDGSGKLLAPVGYLLTGPQTIEFTPSDIVTHTDDGITSTYLRLIDNGFEMKVNSFTVEITDGGRYQYTPATDDADHATLGEHTHAIYNFNEGTLEHDGYTKSELTYADDAQLLGYNPNNASNTYAIQSFNSGDLVKYKGTYYGGLQLLSADDAYYELIAPDGCYMTASVRIHGHDNRDKDESANQDESGKFAPLSYVSSLGGEVFGNGVFGNEETLLDYARDDEYGSTTTLDFEIPAEKSLTFKFSGAQFYGIVDAVCVKTDAVPAIGTTSGTNVLEYTKNEELVQYLIADGNAGPIEEGGVIKFRPTDENQQLWWYFLPINTDPAKRGKISEEYDGKVFNKYKTFSVKNYPFVNVGGKHSTDELNGGNFFKINAPKPKTNKAAWNMMREPGVAEAAETAQEPLELEVKEQGYFYFYIKDTSTSLNSVLVTSGFGLVTGIEEVEIDAVDPEAVDGPMYNVYGQRVDESYRGLVIKNGRKYINR